jgi:hypothetical protein
MSARPGALCRNSARENRVNQSGSVALSTEAMRGSPLAQLIDKKGIYDSKVRATNQGVVGSNPAGRATFQRLRTAKPDPRPACATFARPFIHSLGSRITCFRLRISRLQRARWLSCRRDQAHDSRDRQAVQYQRSRNARASFVASGRVAPRGLPHSHPRHEVGFFVDREATVSIDGDSGCAGRGHELLRCRAEEHFPERLKD